MHARLSACERFVLSLKPLAGSLTVPATSSLSSFLRSGKSLCAMCFTHLTQRQPSTHSTLRNRCSRLRRRASTKSWAIASLSCQTPILRCSSCTGNCVAPKCKGTRAATHRIRCHSSDIALRLVCLCRDQGIIIWLMSRCVEENRLKDAMQIFDEGRKYTTYDALAYEYVRWPNNSFF